MLLYFWNVFLVIAIVSTKRSRKIVSLCLLHTTKSIQQSLKTSSYQLTGGIFEKCHFLIAVLGYLSIRCYYSHCLSYTMTHARITGMQIPRCQGSRQPLFHGHSRSKHCKWNTVTWKLISCGFWILIFTPIDYGFLPCPRQPSPSFP